jgi:hypothetical protein
MLILMLEEYCDHEGFVVEGGVKSLSEVTKMMQQSNKIKEMGDRLESLYSKRAEKKVSVKEADDDAINKEIAEISKKIGVLETDMKSIVTNSKYLKKYLNKRVDNQFARAKQTEASILNTNK